MSPQHTFHHNPATRLYRLAVLVLGVLMAPLALTTVPAHADEGYVEDGKHFDANDEPIYNITEDGTVDWYTYSGFRRYHSECHVCHGPDALGSTYAPALADSLKTMSYSEFLEVVIGGRERTTPAGEISKMPSFGLNVNVSCYIDDLYVYAKARSDDVLPRGRPMKRAQKPQTATEDENACRGDK